MNRRRAIGAEVFSGGVHFRVWAPARRSVAVVDEGSGREFPLDAESGGYFAALIPGLAAGTRYRFRLDGEREAWPDPASRFQPEGPHGPSEVIDPTRHRWQSDWPRLSTKGLVISEIHIGTFTREGTFAAAAEILPFLAGVGINLVEVMPVADFPGRFGWGYDGVNLWAPTRLYGTPDDFRRFVDAAHAAGIGVILDVVYNHFGPDGNSLAKFTPDYFTSRYANEWGDAINYDGERSEGVREFVAENAAYWIDEYRLDGLRLDATQTIRDASPTHVVKEVADRARGAARGRTIFIAAENEPQDVALIDRDGVDAMWNDDWHHSAIVALTGHNEAYYTDSLGRPQEFVSMAKLGFLFQGQRYRWQKQRRGTPSAHLAPERLVCYLENHDQVANSADGARLCERTTSGRMRAMTALLLLAPQTPLLFQGQEFGSTRPFLYFADHKPELAEQVAAGRCEFLAQFPSLAVPEIQSRLALPHDPATFERSRLDHDERARNAHVVRLHRDLIRLRREDPVFAAQNADRLHGAVLSDEAFVLRWMGDAGASRLLIVNLGRDLHLDPAPEPLLAPPSRSGWRLLWSSEAPEYGGRGTPPLESEENWRIPGHAAFVLA